ncbi:hypothetical protein Tco_0127716 [Tanacetum coccineum]
MSLSQAVFSLDVLSIFKTMHQKPQRSNETIIPCNLLPHDQVRSNSHKGNEVAKPVTPQSESVLSCTNIPTTTFELLQNPGHKTEGNKPWLTRQSVRAVWESKEDVVAGARKRRQRDAESSKRVKDYAYHKEKMMMCKQAEQGVPLQAEQADWLEDTDEEIDEQELEAHYSYMAKIQEVSPEESSSSGQPLEQVQNHDENDVFANVRRHSEQPESINDTYVLEKDDSNVISDSSNICTNDNQVDQNAAECVDERAALANLIANLTLDTEENKTILKQLKKANASLTQELKECKTNLDESSRALGEATSSRDRLLARKDIDLGLLAQKHDELAKKSLLTRSQFEGQLKEKTKNLPQKRNQAVRNTNVLNPGMYRIATTTIQTRTLQLPHASRNTNPQVSKSIGVNHTTSVSRPHLKCYQVKDKVVPNNSQVKLKKKEVEDHHMDL